MNFHLFDRLLSMDNVCIPSLSTAAAKKADPKSTKYAGKAQTEGEVVDVKAISKKNSDLAANFTTELFEK